MSLIKQLAGETIFYGLGQILPRILHFLVFSTYLTYRLNESRIDYAIYLDLYAYASVLIVIFSYRMDTAFFRFGTKDRKQQDVYESALIPLLLTSSLLVVTGFIASDVIADWLTYPDRGYYVIWFSIIIAFDVLALLPMARLRLQSRAKTFVSFKILNVGITIALAMLFLEILPKFAPSFFEQLSVHVNSDIDFVFISNMVASGLMLLGLIFIFPLRNINIDWALWSKMIQYTWPLIIVGIAGSINQFFGVPLQKYFLGSDFEINKGQASIYGAVQKIPALLAMFTTAYNYAAEPFFFKHADRKDAKTLYGDIALFFVVIAGIAVLGIYFYIDIFQFLIGSGFREGLYLIPILLLSYLFLGLYYNVSIWYKLSDKTIYGALIASIGAIITIAGSVIFLPVFGIVVSAYSALACYVTMVVLAYFLGKKIYPINYPSGAIVRSIIIIVVFMYLGYLLKSGNIVLNLVSSTILILAYIGLSYLLESKRIKQYF